MSENGAGMLGANTNVSVIKGCFVTSIGVQCEKCHLLNMSPVPLNIAITQQRSMLHIKTIPSI